MESTGGRRAEVLIGEPDGFSASALARLREVAEVRLERLSQQDIPGALDRCDVFWFRLGFRLDADAIAGARRCRILATPVTGLDHIDLTACARAGIAVVSLRGEADFLREVRATAELTVALAIALLRHLPAANADVLHGHWDRTKFRGRELFGKTAGVVGMGRLGGIVAGYLSALGMEVIGFDPFASTPDVETLTDLGQLFERSDLVTLHAAYDRFSTRHLIDGHLLARTKPGAVLVNTARGGLIDEGALLEALESGRLSGAALDVIDGEPHVPIDHPLVRYARTHDNLLLVPHLGGNTVESFEKTERFLADRVADAIGALSLPGAVS